MFFQNKQLSLFVQFLLINMVLTGAELLGLEYKEALICPEKKFLYKDKGKDQGVIINVSYFNHASCSSWPTRGYGLNVPVCTMRG